MSVEHTNDTESRDELQSDCQIINSILSRVGDKWSMLVVMMLGSGPRRFNELKRMIGGHLAADAHLDPARFRTRWLR